MKNFNTKHLDAVICDNGNIKLIIHECSSSPYGYTKRQLRKSCFGVDAVEFTFDYIKNQVKEIFSSFPNEEIHELLNKSK